MNRLTVPFSWHTLSSDLSLYVEDFTVSTNLSKSRHGETTPTHTTTTTHSNFQRALNGVAITLKRRVREGPPSYVDASSRSSGKVKVSS